MHAGRRLARAAARAVLQAGHAAALQMVEDEDAAGAGHLLDEGLGLRVVDPADLVVVPEIAHRAALLGQREALHVERQLAGDRPQIVDLHLVRLERHVRRRVVSARLIGVIARALGWSAPR